MKTKINSISRSYFRLVVVDLTLTFIVIDFTSLSLAAFELLTFNQYRGVFQIDIG